MIMKTSYETPQCTKLPVSIESSISADTSAGDFNDDWIVENPNEDDF